MAGWETIVAAVGGVALGFGLALAWQLREVRSLRRRIYELRAEMRRSVLPVLERRAVELAIPKEQRRSEAPEDPAMTAVTLAEVIRAHEDRQSLPFSDTLDISQDQMQSRARVSADDIFEPPKVPAASAPEGDEEE